MTSRMILRLPVCKGSIIKLVGLGFLIALFVVPVCYLRCDKNKRVLVEDKKYFTGLWVKSDGLHMPLGRILLVRQLRKGPEHCAIKLTKAWVGEGTEELWTEYEIFKKVDSKGRFSGSADVEELHRPLLVGCGHYACSFGENYYIDCGFIDLFWGGPNFISAGDLNSPDKGIEMAPTPWTDISQADVNDPRIKWIRFDGRQLNIKRPIDSFWEDSGDQDNKE